MTDSESPLRSNTVPMKRLALPRLLCLPFSLLVLLLLSSTTAAAAEPEFPLTADSKPQPGVAKGTLIKDRYVAGQDSVFPGTERDYQIYLPAGFAKDGTQPAPFMVFQDGVLYQAPVVFDNLIAKKDIPPLVGIFIRPGVVPAAHENALPRFNRSHEYDSVTDTYSRFLIEEFLPAIEKKHRLKLSTDPNQAAISGNSSGGICAFMTAWHRPDRFRRVFTGVGTYVGIHGADQLPVLVRKIEPKPLRVFLQSGTGDNNLYCGDWWMANQMMERSLTWAGYEVNHAWGEGGHNQKHASQVFPDALRWLWKDWQTNPEVKANVKGESKWKGYEVMTPESQWKLVHSAPVIPQEKWFDEDVLVESYTRLASNNSGLVYAYDGVNPFVTLIDSKVSVLRGPASTSIVPLLNKESLDLVHENDSPDWTLIKPPKTRPFPGSAFALFSMLGRNAVVTHSGLVVVAGPDMLSTFSYLPGKPKVHAFMDTPEGPSWPPAQIGKLCLSPDQTQLYVTHSGGMDIWAIQVQERADPAKEAPLRHGQSFYHLASNSTGGLCVDTEGRLYAATEMGVEVCDQAGRVNFIIPTPKPVNDVCFGGKGLNELFIACGDSLYKRTLKVKGLASGQQAPIKPAPPKL